MKLAPLVVACTAAACIGPVGAPLPVEALVDDPDAQGGHRLDTVVLQEVVDVREGEGARFDVFGGLPYYATPTSDAAALDAMDPDELAAAARGEGGSMRAADIAWDGSRWVARDFEGMEYLTILSTLEEAFRFLDGKGSNPTTALTQKGVVTFFGHGLATPILPIPVVAGDNAAYVPSADMLFVVPTLFQASGTPYFMDSAVAVHELHHRVFQHRVLRGAAYPIWRRLTFPHVYDQPDGTDPEALTTLLSPREARTQMLLAGVNEGVSDVAAAAYAGRSDFVQVLGEEEGRMRDLAGPIGAEATFAQLERGGASDEVVQHCFGGSGSSIADAPQFNFYCLGTILAGTLWSAVDGDPVAYRDEVLPTVEDGLDALGPLIAERTGDGEAFFEPELILQAIVEAADDDLRARLCAVIPTRFPAEDQEVPPCP